MTTSPRKTRPPLSTAAAAEEAHISRRAVIAAIERGTLIATKLPGPQGQYVIDPADLRAWRKSIERREAERAARLAAKAVSA